MHECSKLVGSFFFLSKQKFLLEMEMMIYEEGVRFSNKRPSTKNYSAKEVEKKKEEKKWILRQIY